MIKFKYAFSQILSSVPSKMKGKINFHIVFRIYNQKFKNLFHNIQYFLAILQINAWSSVEKRISQWTKFDLPRKLRLKIHSKKLLLFHPKSSVNLKESLINLSATPSAPQQHTKEWFFNQHRKNCFLHTKLYHLI